MKKLILNNGNKQACLRVMVYVSENMPLKREEFKLLDRAIKWLKNPSSKFAFHFFIGFSSGGESINADVEYDGW